MSDSGIRELERQLVGDPTNERLKRKLEKEKWRAGANFSIPGYDGLIGKRVLLLGARWHYEGDLVGSNGDYLLLEKCRQIFNYTLEEGISASDMLPGTVSCNHTHVASACESPFDGKTKKTESE